MKMIKFIKGLVSNIIFDLAFGALLLVMLGYGSWYFFYRPGKLVVPEKFVVINVLDKKLYEDCRIKGSINIPFDEFEQEVQKNLMQKKWNHDTELVVHCSNYKCTASWTAAAALQKMGFTKVWAYEAGTAEAHQQGLTQGPCTEEYLHDFQKPEGYISKETVNVIDTQTLKKKLQEFALIQ